jgi:outer membrane protein assembly factor BamB
MRFFKSLQACILFLVTLASASAADWNRFRGPDGQGIADSTVPVQWSQQDHVPWKLDLPGQGSSSPIVVDNKVLVTCYSGTTGADAKRHLVCADAITGKQLWSLEVDARQPEDQYQGFITEHGYASGTPVTDGQNVYAFFGKSGVVACTLDGKKLWQTFVGQDSSNRRWGSGSSLVLYDDIVIVNASEESRSIRGLNKTDGTEVWKAEYDLLELCYATPVLAEGEGGVMEAVISMPGEVWGLNPEHGKLRWFCEIGTGGNVSPGVVVGEDAFYTFGGFPQQQTNAIRRSGRKDITSTHKLWESRDSSYVATPLLLGDHLYWVNDRGQAFGMNAKTGETLHRARLTGLQSGGRPVYSSPVKAGEYIYVVSRRSGTYVFEADPQMKQVAHNPALDDSDFNATPAIVNGRMYLRSDKALYCIQ